MKLPHSKIIATYTEEITAVEADLKQATSGEGDNSLLPQVQKQLDALAEKYQYKDEIGTARYKLYELQALAHYFTGNDELALDFINHAIETRGENYPRAQKLKTQLMERASLPAGTTDKKKKSLAGLEGWLALFVVAVGIGILTNIVNLAGYPSAFNDVTAVSAETIAYAQALTPLLWYEVFMNIALIGTAVWLLVLLAQHKKSAKTVAISFLAATVLLGIFDYVWATAVFETYEVTQYVVAEMNSAAGDILRAIFVAAVWTPYFLVSKRVKATLTN